MEKYSWPSEVIEHLSIRLATGKEPLQVFAILPEKEKSITMTE